MALDFAAQIHALSGFDSDATTDTETGDDFDEAAAQWMTDGAREVIAILSKGKSGYVDLMTTSSRLNSTTTTLSLTSNKAENVVLYNGTRYTSCRRIDASKRGQENDINDLMNYATTSDPVYWINAGTLETFPTPTDSNYVDVDVLNFPTFTAGDAGTYDITSATSISSFPDEAEHLVVLYAAIKATEYMMLFEEDQEVYGPQLQNLKQDYKEGLAFIGGGGGPAGRR